jgi:hypothetical protein
MAITTTLMQAGDLLNSDILSAGNPLFWIVQVDASPSDNTIYIEAIIETDYVFRFINKTFNGVTGLFLFDGSNIFSALLNEADDIIPSTQSVMLATEMFKELNVSFKIYSYSGATSTEFLDKDYYFVKSAKDIGTSKGATLVDWEQQNSKLFLSQADKFTYWYFWEATKGDRFLEYRKINSLPQLYTLMQGTSILMQGSAVIINSQ